MVAEYTNAEKGHCKVERDKKRCYKFLIWKKRFGNEQNTYSRWFLNLTGVSNIVLLNVNFLVFSSLHVILPGMYCNPNNYEERHSPLYYCMGELETQSVIHQRK